MLLFKKKYKYIFLVIPLVILFRYDLVFFSETMEGNVGEIFLMHLFGGSYQMEKANLTISVTGLIGIMYLTLLFADYVIHDMTEGAEYIFSRATGRSKWYKKKLCGLLGYCNLGVLLYIFFYIWVGIRETEQGLQKKDVLLMICTYIMLVLFTYCSILCINMLSLIYSITIGVVIYYSMVVISSMAMILIQGISNPILSSVLHRINPMSNVLVSWNFSDFYVIWAMGYYSILAMMLGLVLWKRVKNYEIGVDKGRGV